MKQTLFPVFYDIKLLLFFMDKLNMENTKNHRHMYP